MVLEDDHTLIKKVLLLTQKSVQDTEVMIKDTIHIETHRDITQDTHMITLGPEGGSGRDLTTPEVILTGKVIENILSQNLTQSIVHEEVSMTTTSLGASKLLSI